MNEILTTIVDEEDFISRLVEETKRIVNDEKMTNKCDMCQGIIGRYLQEQDLSFYPCSTNKVITTNITGHSFIVLPVNDDYYLLDPAFVQFKYDNSEEKIINGIKCTAKSPYYYMSMINQKYADELIEKGFFKLDDDRAYAYGNAFYFTKVGLPENFKLKPINGATFINAFKKGNDKLIDYGIGNIEFTDGENKSNKHI